MVKMSFALHYTEKVREERDIIGLNQEESSVGKTKPGIQTLWSNMLYTVDSATIAMSTITTLTNLFYLTNMLLCCVLTTTLLYYQ